MGAWGTGPFDSDGALDYLGDLAHSHAERDDDFDIIPGSVDHKKVTAALAETLATVARQAGEDEDRGYIAEDAYTAAGLVAAVLHGYTGPSGGTRLFAAMDAAKGAVDTTSTASVFDMLGLASHCGYTTLLRREDAEPLRTAALAAVAALRTETTWLALWNVSTDLLEQLIRLESALAP